MAFITKNIASAKRPKPTRKVKPAKVLAARLVEAKSPAQLRKEARIKRLRERGY